MVYELLSCWKKLASNHQDALTKRIVEELRIIKKTNKQNPSNNDQSTVTKASPIYGINPFLDDNGVLRVGG